MPSPKVTHGQFHVGADCVIGENVVVDVDEEVRFGDRCVIPDNAYFSGRRVTFGDDFYGYSWEWRRLDVGRGRRGEEDAVLEVGSRCTFHDNRIDLARRVTIGSDVGLSPETVIYTHYYWQSPLDGYPMKYDRVAIDDGAIVGFRSTILPGVTIGYRAVIGAGSVVVSDRSGMAIHGGVPAEWIRNIPSVDTDVCIRKLADILGGYPEYVVVDYPMVGYRGMMFNVKSLTCSGQEDEYTDDFRWFLFRHGLRFYTKRPFKKLKR